ncbi:uncharacterized protein N7482_003218 [Penicillium canariense]|uniref:Uncharacterized protein n=1 Tax=Penicillium canariense TaxID=189055 RepID=A0A9W9I445_9EURO|nr:uncharacterized protein N7482_003218 [Penicillium canariense]KAJ5167624.1 hypothetical protein N7482_003218 [Penicillium canariense]
MASYRMEPWYLVDASGQTLDGLAPCMAHEELHPSYLAEAGQPFVMQGDLDPGMMDHLGWHQSELAAKVGGPQRYPQSWVEAGLTIHPTGHKLDDSSARYHQPYVESPRSDDAERQRWIALMATQRALFMTPSGPPAAFPTFPGSPISDPCGTPEPSHASFGRWETDQDSEDMQSSRCPGSPPAHTVAPNMPIASHASQQAHEEDYPTMLEMPDGSTRQTSNWLPVDSSAGFTIGTDPFRAAPGANDPETHDLYHISGAFISMKPVG